MDGAPELHGTLLVVDDDDRHRDRLALALGQRGLRVVCAHDFGSAVSAQRAQRPAYAVVDLRLPGRDGIDLVRALKAADPGIRIVMLTGWGSIATAVEAVRSGAYEYLTKPADADQVLEALGTRAGRGVAGAEGPERSAPSLARVEWEHIQRVLAECEGNISQAARVLGIHRRSLQRKLAKYPPRR